MDYKEKLKEWNSTEKYKNEILFLNKLLPEPKYALDYGCGRGVCAYVIGADGYDINDYNECLRSFEYHNSLPDNDYTDVYFMHSFSHISNPKEVLAEIKSKYPKAIITIITPNKDWISKQNNPDYIPDTTVYKHYTQKELKEILKSCGYLVTLYGQFGEEVDRINERLFIQCK
jgi:hypothetical protein